MAKPEPEPVATEPIETRQPGWREVLLVGSLVVVVVLGAAMATSLLPTELQEVVFHTPLLIIVLLLGTAGLLWRITRGRPTDG